MKCREHGNKNRQNFNKIQITNIVLLIAKKLQLNHNIFVGTFNSNNGISYDYNQGVIDFWKIIKSKANSQNQIENKTTTNF